ncbi:MAG TPA: diguanylate cyclase [Thermoanaerobaculia bacterium]
MSSRSAKRKDYFVDSATPEEGVVPATGASRRRSWIEQLGSQLVDEALLAPEPLDCLNRVTRSLHRHFDLVLCGLFLVGDRGLQQDTLSGPSFWSHDVGKRWSLDRGLVGRCFRTGEPVFVPDVRRDPDYVLADPAVGAEFLIPLRFDGRVLGVLNLEARGRKVFTASARRQLLELAERIGGFIHLAHLSHRLSATTAALEAANRRLASSTRRLRQLATRDELTGIANRRHFERFFEQSLARLERSGDPVSLLLLDVDHFKSYNDRLGHHAGDRALRRVAQALRKALPRRTDLLARYGGEEFAVVLGRTSPSDALVVAERLRLTVEALGLPHEASPHGLLTISLGLAGATQPVTRDLLVQAADRALYAAKKAGRNRLRSRAAKRRLVPAGD